MSAQATVLYTIILFSLLLILIIVRKCLKINIIKPKSQLEDYPKFEKNVTFKEYPEILEINLGKETCNAKTLKECLLDDPLTLFGCRELNVRCQNFDKDTRFKDENGEEFIIPKNKDSNHGYALVIRSITENCNIWHGDPVLVAATINDESFDTGENSYLLICQCKNPGYIGNENILGSCETPFICNGQIDDINKPLNEINCKCSSTEKSVRYMGTGLPVCKDLLVKDLNERSSDWTNQITWQHDRLQPIDAFPKYIRDNLNINKYYDPCKSSVEDVTKRVEAYRVDVPNIFYPATAKSKSSYGCKYMQEGVPVYSMREKDFKESDDNFPNAVISSSKWTFVRYTSFVADQKSPLALKAIVPLIDENRAVVVVPKRRAWPFFNIWMKCQKRLLSGKCEGVLGGQECWVAEKFSYFDYYGLPVPRSRGLPFGHSDRSIWPAMEHLSEQHYLGLDMRSRFKLSGLNYYGALYVLRSFDNTTVSGPMRFEDAKDFLIHKNSLTDEANKVPEWS